MTERLPDEIGQSLSSAVAAGKLSPVTNQNLTRWLSEPYYLEYRSQLIRLVQQSDFAELNKLFWERIPFGTGGRRGPMSEFGSATINARTIAESAQGLAQYVKRFQKEAGSSEQLRVVIARDTRHRSDEFARLTASIMAANGFQVYFFPEPRATPELSFAVRFLQCDTGVMISASHNPPCDNGFKAYWSSGGQVLPPHDKGIIECVDACQEIPILDFEQAIREQKIILLTSSNGSPDVDQAYVNAVCKLSLSQSGNIRALYTPMHGVGESSIYQVVQQAGFTNVDLYEPQCSRDGSFPNVPDHLPNPERTQALQPAIEFAKQHGHEIVLASDPDADRLAIAVRTKNDQFTCLTGNQLGVLIADYVLSRRAKTGTLSPQHYLVETLVTTPMFISIGRSYDVRVIRDLLVGFKYIAAAIDENGPDHFVFAAEESVGYLAGQYCRDKDASVAALFGLELANELRRDGKTLVDRLDELYIQHGFYHESQFVLECPGSSGSEQIGRMMAALRNHTPTSLGAIEFESTKDYKLHQSRSLITNESQSLPAPSGDLLILEGRCGPCRVSLAGRPSGTEPKIKFYLFVNLPVDLPLVTAKSLGKQCLIDLQSSLKQWLTASVS